MTDIVVAGAGHGGLVAAALLAKEGFNVRVFEAKNRDNLGWDWHDDFKLHVFENIGMPVPNQGEIHLSPDVTFFSPDLASSIEAHVPAELRSIGMDRKVLAEKLIKFAIEAGVKIEFNTKVKGPLIKDQEVVGLVTETGPVEASLVIDAAGMDSPVRKNLPKNYGIRDNLLRGEVFHSYRAYFDNVEPTRQEYPIFHVQFGIKGIRGITWVRILEDSAQVDVIVGKSDPFKKGELDEILGELRKHYPCIGETVVRGGQFAKIPVRRPLDRFLGPNYVAVGDSACMTVPLTGSGIETSMLAGKLLAETIIDLGSKPSYGVQDLWRYQGEYVKNIGAINYSVDIIKNFLGVVPFPEMNFIFQKRLITGDDIASSVMGEELNISILEMLKRLFRGFPRMGLLLKVKNMAQIAKKVQDVAKKIPLTYEEAEINSWVQEMAKFYENYEKEIRSVAQEQGENRDV
ncbi:MAG: NAD(P)/FAD-dependent oxidoreductase [Candidatus Hodarchaeota archaeon]